MEVHTSGLGDRRKQRSPPRTRNPAHLEDITEIGGAHREQLDLASLACVILEGDLLMPGAVMQKTGACDMQTLTAPLRPSIDRTRFKRAAAGARLHAERLHPLVINEELAAREEPRVVVIKALLHPNGRPNIAGGIQHREGCAAILQTHRARIIRKQRRVRAHKGLAADLQHIP